MLGVGYIVAGMVGKNTIKKFGQKVALKSMNCVLNMIDLYQK